MRGSSKLFNSIQSLAIYLEDNIMSEGVRNFTVLHLKKNGIER